MDDGDIVNILNGTGPGSTPEEPLALVAKMTDAERSALESGERSGLASVDFVSDTTSPEIQYRMSIQHSLFSFCNISTVEGSVLFSLRYRL